MRACPSFGDFRVIFQRNSHVYGAKSSSIIPDLDHSGLSGEYSHVIRPNRLKTDADTKPGVPELIVE